MHAASAVFTLLAALVLVAVDAQMAEFFEGCTTPACRRDSFLMQEREKLNEMQVELMEMLLEIQMLNDQEAYIMGHHGAAIMGGHQQGQIPMM